MHLNIPVNLRRRGRQVLYGYLGLTPKMAGGSLWLDLWTGQLFGKQRMFWEAKVRLGGNIGVACL